MSPVSEKRTGRTLALIPAKGGSTRLAMKNVALLGGRPLIAWTIDAARDSGIFDRIVVSTENCEIARIAGDLGAAVPFIRPEKLARDPAGVVDVALHALEQLEASGELFETICILLPTSPLRTSQDINDAFEMFRNLRGSNLMSIGPFEHTPFAALSLGEGELLAPHFPEYYGRKSQEMPLAFRPNGAIHILKVDWLAETRSYLASPIIGYSMPWERSVDIDTISDLLIAEAILTTQIPECH